MSLVAGRGYTARGLGQVITRMVVRHLRSCFLRSERLGYVIDLAGVTSSEGEDTRLRPR